MSHGVVRDLGTLQRCIKYIANFDKPHRLFRGLEKTWRAVELQTLAKGRRSLLRVGLIALGPDCRVSDSHWQAHWQGPG